MLPDPSLLPSCVKLIAVAGNNYELKLHYISMLYKFIGFNYEEAYLFNGEFQGVRVMIKLQYLLKMQLDLTSFHALSMVMPRSAYNMPIDFITS